MSRHERRIRAEESLGVNLTAGLSRRDSRSGTKGGGTSLVQRDKFWSGSFGPGSVLQTYSRREELKILFLVFYLEKIEKKLINSTIYSARDGRDEAVESLFK